MAAAGASATTIAITSVAFAVTGISAKINKVASSVFGEDLVKIGNIFGAAYAAWNGGFDIGGSSGAADAASAAGSGAQAGTDSFSAVNLTGAATDAAGAGTGFNLANMADPLSGTTDLLSATDPSALGYVNQMDMGTDALSVLGGGATPAPVSAGSANVFSGAGGEAGGASLADAGRTVAGTGAAAPNAAGAISNEAILPSYDQLYGKDSLFNSFGLNQNATAPQTSFFSRMLEKDGSVKPAALQLGGSLIQGVGQGYAGAQTAKQRAAELAEMRRRMNISTGIRVTN